MLKISNLQKQFGGQVLFKDAEVTIHAGEKVGLIGANGTGKSTLFRIIQGAESDGGSIHLPPRLRIGELRQELEASERTILQETVQGDRALALLQEERETLRHSLEHGVGRQNMADQVRRLGEIDHRLEELGAYSAESRAGAILLGLGFSLEDMGRSLRDFSGGWRMRVALAALLFARPDLMLLDEPTNHLDLESVAWLEGYLRQLPGTLIVISHDRAFLNRVVAVIVELEHARLTRYHGNFDRFLEQKAENAERLEKMALNQGRRIAELSCFIRRFRAKATKARQVQSRIKMLEKMERVEVAVSSEAAPRIRLPEPSPAPREVCLVRRMAKGYDGVPLFTNVELVVQRGEKIGLLGANGAGKSTLLKLLAGELAVDGGEIRLGERVKGAYFAQHALEALDPDKTILATAEEAATGRGIGGSALRSLLGGFLFSGETVEKRVAALSGGERARLALAKLFLSGANLLFLDEPTNHLDMYARAALEEALESYAGTLLLVSHDRDLLDAVCTRYLVVEAGGIRVLEEPLEEYLEKVASRRENSVEPPVAGARLGERERRRLNGEIRNRLATETKQLRRESERLEAIIYRLEEEQTQLEARLASTELYEETQRERLLATMAKAQAVQRELETAMIAWEQCTEQIEAKELIAKRAMAEI